MLHYKTIELQTLKLLKELQINSLFQNTCLVGGTALALQIGHRQSIDLDIFGYIPYSSEEIRNSLVGHDVTILKESENINIYKVDDIKVDFVNYRYKWIEQPFEEKGIKLASIKDIAAMKVYAAIGRGTKKDFIDIYYLLKKFSINEILDLYMQKYPEGSRFIAMKSLVYFDDAEHDPMPLMFRKIKWDSIKKSICKAVREI